jgi:hypothetical protein
MFADRQQQIDDVAAPVELDARTGGISVGLARECVEGGPDPLVDAGRFALETQAKVPATRKRRDLQSEGLRVIVVAQFGADAIFARRTIERAEELPPTQPDSGLQLLLRRTRHFRVVVTGTVDHRDLVAFNEDCSLLIDHKAHRSISRQDR